MQPKGRSILFLTDKHDATQETLNVNLATSM